MPGTSQRCEALILRHVDYGEADRIISLLTLEFGLQKGFAKAARNSRKRFGAALEPFSQVVAHWRQGRGQFWSLQEVELLSSRSGLRADFKRLALASYAVELVEMLLDEGQPQPRIFELLCALLDFLEQSGDPDTARLLYELRLVYLLGYIPHLLHCSECLKIFIDESVCFDTSRGGSLCHACAAGEGLEVGLGTLGSLARTLNVTHQRFDGFHFGAQTLSEAGQILNQVLNEVLPRTPKSLRFL